MQLPTTTAAAAAAAQAAAALQLNGTVPLGALNPAALTGRLKLGKGRNWVGAWKEGILCAHQLIVPLFLQL